MSVSTQSYGEPFDHPHRYQKVGLGTRSVITSRAPLSSARLRAVLRQYLLMPLPGDQPPSVHACEQMPDGPC